MSKRSNKETRLKQIQAVISRAAFQDVLVKEQTAELKADKEFLTDWYEEEGYELGKVHAGLENTQVTFSEADVFEPIPLDLLMVLLKQQGKEDKLLDCVVVNMAKLRKVLGADDIKDLQGESIGTKYSLKLKVIED